jgi:mono/diheme cytochrome c family protein
MSHRVPVILSAETWTSGASGPHKTYGIVWGFSLWLLLALLVVFVFGAATFPLSAQKSANLTAELPPGDMQAKATTACLECHEARIILQQRLSQGAWTKEVDKMTKWGALVDPADRDALIAYLSSNFSPDKPPYEPPHTSGKK